MRKTPGLMIGRFAGAPIYLQRSWFPLMGFIIAGYGMRLASWHSLSTFQGYLAAAVVAITLALGVFLHELAHATVGRARKARVSSITLNMWGGQTLLHTMSASTALWVALAGPLMNFVVALACQIIWALTGTAEFYGFHLAVQVNLAIGLFNLLPTFPLDGGYAVEALIFLVLRSRSKAHALVTYTGFLLLALLIGFLLMTGFWQSPITLIVGALLIVYIGAGLLPAVQKLGMNSDTGHPLHVQQLIGPASCEFDSELIGLAAQGWDGRSDIVLISQGQGKPEFRAVVPASTLRASYQSLAYQPLAAIAQPLQRRHLTLSSGPTDIIDEYQGFASYTEPPAENALDRIWLVTGTAGPLGTVTAQDIAGALSSITPPSP